MLGDLGQGRIVKGGDRNPKPYISITNLGPLLKIDNLEAPMGANEISRLLDIYALETNLVDTYFLSKT